MALRKEIITASGVTADYWRIIGCTYSVDDATLEISMALYINEDARINGMTYLDTKSVITPVLDSNEESATGLPGDESSPVVVVPVEPTDPVADVPVEIVDPVADIPLLDSSDGLLTMAYGKLKASIDFADAEDC